MRLTVAHRNQALVKVRGLFVRLAVIPAAIEEPEKRVADFAPTRASLVPTISTSRRE